MPERRAQVGHLLDPNNHQAQRQFEKLGKLTNKACSKTGGVLEFFFGNKQAKQLEAKLANLSPAEFMAFQEYYYMQNGVPLYDKLSATGSGRTSSSGINEKFLDGFVVQSHKAFDWYQGKDCNRA
ncbi:hypothetical protein tpqmel_0020 [Candidatus Gastranaerophilus sp. (ex Termes propinquus)]|nr:hypothetical protein tpqmel_0020 [Candidatus Gastranaerophilus sp. (ex Termes propinquus)]